MAARASPPEHVADRLHSAAIHLLRRLRRHDARLGIGPAGLSALSVLVFGGPKTVGELAAIEQVRAPTMSRLLAGLEKNGLVVRTSDPVDRRTTRVQPTALGKRVLVRGRERRVHDLAGRLRTLTPEDVALLDRAAALIERLVAAPRSTP